MRARDAALAHDLSHARYAKIEGIKDASGKAA
jgi:hypothetical protein